MKASKISLIKKLVPAFAIVFATLLFTIPAEVQAEEATDECLVLVVNDQAGMGKVESYYNGQKFTDSISVPQGSVIILKAEYYPRCTFEGWWMNNELYRKEANASITVTGPMCVLTAKFDQQNSYIPKQAEQKFVQTSWVNQNCRFVKGKEMQYISVTSSLVLQGEACINAFNLAKEDYTIARTYNIIFTNQKKGEYPKKLDTPGQFVMQIPAQLQAEGRDFRMISVFEGQPTVLTDEDADPTTITFTTDKSGAYALIYKDTAAVPVAE